MDAPPFLQDLKLQDNRWQLNWRVKDKSMEHVEGSWNLKLQNQILNKNIDIELHSLFSIDFLFSPNQSFIHDLPETPEEEI